MESGKKVPTPSRYGPTLLPTMNYLQAPGMRNLRSPSRESIASDFSVMSMSSHLGGVDGLQRRKRMQCMSKSRETLNSGFDQLSVNVSMDVPTSTGQPEDFLIPGQNAFVKPHQQLTRCFSFTDIRSTPLDQDDALREGPAAVSDPSLSVNSDFDDEISMFFDDKGEPINFRNDGDGDDPVKVSAVIDQSLLFADDVIAVPGGPMAPGKRSKLRHRIKRKFLNFSFNELLRRRKSKKSPVPPASNDPDRQSTGGSPSPKPEKRCNVFPQPDSMKTLTDRDIEREQGKALSKYSRNLMIFNWLHNTEETWFSSQMQ